VYIEVFATSPNLHSYLMQSAGIAEWPGIHIVL